MVKESSGAGKRLLIRVFLVAFSLVFSFLSPVVVNAISSAQLYEFSQNNSLFYEPGNDDCLMAMSVQNKRESSGGDVYMLGEASTLSNELQNGIKNRFPNILINAVSGLSFDSKDAISSVWTAKVIEDAESRGILVLTFGTGTQNFNIQTDIIDRLAGRDVKLVFVTAYKSGSINSKGVFEEDTLNARMQSLAKNNENVYLVDFAGNINASNETKYMQKVGNEYKMTTTGMDLYIRLLASVINDLSVVNDDVDGVEGLAQVNIDFINKYHDYAQELSIAYGIPWETVMAQGILESASGTSTFATQRHNFFGIAAYDSNTDAAYSYGNDKQGWQGYYENIKITSVYRNNGVFQGATVTDPYEYLVAIKQAGYATSETYVQNVSPIIKSIEEYSKKKGWLSSVALAAQYPEWYQHAAENAAGSNASTTSTTATSPYCSLENSNGTYPPTIAGESNVPIRVNSWKEAAQVACDPRTTEVGIVYGRLKKNGQTVSVPIRLCKLDKPGYQIIGNDGGYSKGVKLTWNVPVMVSSIVSGAFAGLANAYQLDHNGKVLEATSAFRTAQYQKYLRENNEGAAEVSKHETGLAIDIETGCSDIDKGLGTDPGECHTPTDDWLTRVVGRGGSNPFGTFQLTRPVTNEGNNGKGEPWHVQMPISWIDSMKVE